MENMSTNSPKTIRFYNLLLCLFGIHTKLLDFHYSFNDATKAMAKSLQKSLLTLASAIIFIAFILHYPILVSIIIMHLPFEKRKKCVEFFVYYAQFYIKYVVIIIIYIFELLTEKSTILHQHKIECILLRIDKMFTYWSKRSKQNQFKSTSLRETLINLSILTKSRLFQISIIIGCCFAFNCLKYSNAFQGFEYYIFGSLPSVFISIFVLHFSTIIIQYTKLFRLLNKITEVIASDIVNRISVRTKETNWKGKTTIYRFNETSDNNRQLQLAIDNISTLIETHDELRANIAKLRKYHSIQLNAVILNAFVNIIFEVRTIYLRQFLSIVFQFRYSKYWTTHTQYDELINCCVIIA